MLQDEEWYWDEEQYQADLARVGIGGAPVLPSPVPIQGLFIEHMEFRPTIYALADHRERIDRYVEIAGKADDAMYEVICKCRCPSQPGRNIDAHLDPPPVWKEHLLPWYRLRTEQLLRRASSPIHVDGAMRPLLGHMRDCPWDGIGQPPGASGRRHHRGDQEALGDLVLLDGIPGDLLPAFYR